ncbi:Glucoamylase and related glycosyl hydrolases [Actinomyces bovis]|uniref:Glucoamylase and related glycosyl hydrolases n=1 Tax=Actinomyces bovis TaxID=1658 RepID=A0ABY1VQF9_9ACTO|nr:glycoside hydrolase family 15 [Actinomyces bovis]SPT53637.1 Glucoamylase and related glycosyl hydrolases [Actinomyces bovis]VEG55704.1 Glucoamylase and related glycosyl hydrolases [Actinomyces israelii]
MRRRNFLLGAASLPAAALLGGLGVRALLQRPTPTLLSGGLAVGADGVLWPLPPGVAPTYLPGSRVPADDSVTSRGLDPVQRERLAQAARDRRAGAQLPAGRWEALCSAALDDLLALTGPVLANTAYPRGAVVAGPVSWWRYTWPRDASFAALALARCGLHHEALAVLTHLASLQGPDGSYAARYTAAGGLPDARPPQTDGVGWFTWASVGVLKVLPTGSRPDDLATLEAALCRSGERLVRLTAGPTGLPPASPDYWEVRERFTTLGTAAATLLGLEAVATRPGLPEGLSARAAASAARLREAMCRAYAPTWGRYPERVGAAVGSPGQIDAALALVLPPFTTALPGAEAVRTTALARMARPAGGVAPGEGWRRDGVSWTPETALLAWSAAGLGWRQEAEELLAWLEAHRTAAGALPEKVLADGSPAGPAPLAWTCALVLLAAHELVS